MQTFAFIKSGSEEGGPYLFPVAMGVPPTPAAPQSHPYSSLGRGLLHASLSVDIPFKIIGARFLNGNKYIVLSERIYE